MLSPTIFREYDIRGIADRDLTGDGVFQLGQALGTFLQRNAGPDLMLGRDTRLSSPRLRDALIGGMKASGAHVRDIGVVPTPVLYHAAYKSGAHGAVMITGSHNPAEYNGFKTVLGHGTIYGPQIQELLRIIRDGDYLTGEGSERPVDATAAYVDDIAAMFRFARRIKVVIDAGNGTGGPVMRRLLERLDVDATEMFFDMDGHFPNHHPDPTMPDNLQHLIEKVRETGADLGIAFDGDTDRIGAVDDQGNVVWGDQLMILYAREILARKPGATFIGEVKCSEIMYDEIRRLGGNPIMWKTGHSLIKAKMKETHAELAGEMSGHMFFADRYYGFDDALYAACRLIEIVAASDRPLSKALAELPGTVVTPELRYDLPDDIKFDVVKRVRDQYSESHDVNTVDGVRIKFPEGWGLVRASNTQPALVLRFEARSEEALNAYRAEVEKAVARARAAFR